MRLGEDGGTLSLGAGDLEACVHGSKQGAHERLVLGISGVVVL